MHAGSAGVPTVEEYLTAHFAVVGNAAALHHKQGTVTYLGKAESVTAFAQGWSIDQKISKLWCTAFHHAGKTGVFQQQGRAAGGAGGRNQAGAADLGVVENFLQRNAAGKIVCQTRHFVFTGQPRKGGRP